MADATVTGFPKILLFGDSLTQHSFSEGGFGAAIANHFERKCDIVNRGFSGYTSAMNKRILPQILQQENTAHSRIIGVVVLLGSNDACVPEIEARGLPLPEYVEHMRDIIEQLMNASIPKDKIILVSPPPVCEDKWKQDRLETGHPMSLSSKRISQYAEACTALGNKLGLTVLDLHSAVLQQPDWTDLLSDGLHFSVQGNRFVAKQLVQLLDDMFKHLPKVFPDWKDIDPKNLEKYLPTSC